MPMMRRILCPVDFSETSAHAVDLATAVARWYESQITALHVVTPAITPYPGLPAVDVRTNPMVDQAEQRRLRSRRCRSSRLSTWRPTDTRGRAMLPRGWPRSSPPAQPIGASPARSCATENLTWRFSGLLPRRMRISSSSASAGEARSTWRSSDQRRHRSFGVRRVPC